ncbi:VCBS repeat-containing protein [bacterium]|nr:VCBS repeat-containing protein [bacterium]
MRLGILLTIGFSIGGQTLFAVDIPKFEPQTLDDNIGNVCYTVTSTDVNGDGRPDIVAVSENRVQWYENPTWAKHIILEDQVEKDHVCIAPYDIDGDGQIDFALGAGWTKIGTLQWITRGTDPQAKWNVYFIGQETWLHRMSFADVLGTGRPQLVISPLNKTVADGVRLTAFEIPAHPKTDRWPATILDESLNRMHNHTHLAWDKDPIIDTVVASEQGVFVIQRDAATGTFRKQQIGSGASGDKPELRGAGEIKIGHLADGRRFAATVEPMHGTMAVVYLPGADGQLWTRVVLDDSLKQGHAVWLADLDGVPGDEVIIGHREAGTGTVTGPGLYAYQSQSGDGRVWKKTVIDNGGCAVEDAIAVDLDADGDLDLVAGGRATHNVKIYWNRLR